MTSSARLVANRRNALRSSGPRTTRGKARSSRNALLHGLSLSVRCDSESGAKIDALAEKMRLAIGTSPETASLLAEARISLLRAREALVRLIDQGLREQVGTPQEGLELNQRIGLAVTAKASKLASYGRYERRAWSRLKKLLALVGKHSSEPEEISH
ncbi:MAG: hypothetical protein WBO12_00870 [Xanthobacteraceae bacterium]|jgi:hypothetical protein